MILRHVLILVLALAVSACAAVTHPAGPATQAPRLEDDRLVMADGAVLPLRAWRPGGQPQAVLLALHGMNDYSNFFAAPGAHLAAKGILSYAYDQRGFGAGPHPGQWSSTQSMVDDARAALDLLALRHPGLPVYLFGESMGGAVAILVATDPPAGLDGIILAAPAVWGRAAMPWWQRLSLWLAYQLAPGWTPSGQGLNIRPSDNIEMLRKLGADPLVIKQTRIDAIKGVVDLMDAAQAAPAAMRTPVLFLYGAHDQIIPSDPTWAAAAVMPDRRAGFYANGWHMLVRDLQADVVLDDMAAWMADADAALPSGADSAAPQLPEVCSCSR
ncbi:lysophospholipase [Magnetospirillum sulfuroxidans]|uniref:alpha/beta hydrolase n=1 Tax=Magnetospirillum sulfuroxidans TaxID=611300 RepID=UPI0031FEDF09